MAWACSDVDIGDADQFDVGKPRENAGVFLAEMSDADHCHA